MNIKEIEERSGLTRANIRYYEQEGCSLPRGGRINTATTARRIWRRCCASRCCGISASRSTRSGGCNPASWELAARHARAQRGAGERGSAPAGGAERVRCHLPRGDKLFRLTAGGLPQRL